MDLSNELEIEILGLDASCVAMGTSTRYEPNLTWYNVPCTAPVIPRTAVEREIILASVGFVCQRNVGKRISIHFYFFSIFYFYLNGTPRQ